MAEEILAKGAADVRVLSTKNRWYGMTYAADREAVKQASVDLTEQGVYSAEMWE